MGGPLRRLLGAMACAFVGCAQAQTPPPSAVLGDRIQHVVNGVLGLTGYSVVPDLTASSLSIDNGGNGNPQITLSQLAGGFTPSRKTPVYVEGGIAYSRYDPEFVFSNGQEQRTVPVKWISVALTGGVGWDFPIAQDLYFRPIFNFSLGRVTSDLRLASLAIDYRRGTDLDFLDNGHLDSYGLGGSLMLDYEMVRPDQEIDIELRYTNVELRSHGGSTLGVVGHAKSESISLWARMRVPTGWGVVWDRPVRYVYEAATTRYLGAETELGLKQMSSVGLGLELDSSALDRWATRWRAIARYKFGPGMHGTSLGLAISF